ncbi:recombination regulator RecX [Neobacillus bataviensis LMG 21833]|uniref:Regulatory protein RecX n=1 Tax=Neobacillus bataviensis LMG 21833 TaxID=1117379 RepID=K6EDX8_9BACI|nr:recombination regulator RecX [Neobacillus bataviensis]EKN71686.1 recombination regulator RecX [Neobacillus bataviensis LMG 21833]
MAIITKITTQQKNKDRFNVFMDYGKGEEFAFSVDSDVLIKHQLKKGMELDDFSLLEIQYQDDIRKAYNLAVNYLARRMRAEKEIRDYLVKKEIDEPIIKEVLHRLTAQKYINDEEFALAFVRTQANTTDKGPNVIKMDLKEKGMKETILLRALEEFPLEQQIEKATKISEKFFQKNTKESIKILKQKLENVLLRKGYSFEVITIAVNETELPKEADEEMEAIRFQGEKANRKFSQFTGYEYQQKMKQALYRKGFSIDLIERFLAELENS